MFLHIFELRVQNNNLILNKTGFLMWSQIFRKIAEKGPLKTLKKYSKKY